jgi:hypothetical protein
MSLLLNSAGGKTERIGVITAPFHPIAGVNCQEAVSESGWRLHMSMQNGNTQPVRVPSVDVDLFLVGPGTCGVGLGAR